ACLNLRVLGVHVDGGMSDLLTVPARLLLRAGDLPVDAVAMVEMLSVGEHAAARANLAHDDRVLVVGAGPIGLAATAAARRRTPRASCARRPPRRPPARPRTSCSTPPAAPPPWSRPRASSRRADGWCWWVTPAARSPSTTRRSTASS